MRPARLVLSFFFLETFGPYVSVIRFFSGEAEAGDEVRLGHGGAP
jgi:hypothetical protein